MYLRTRYLLAVVASLALVGCGGGSGPVVPPTGGEAVTFTVTPESGGSAALLDVGSVTIPGGVLPSEVTAELRKTTAERAQQGYDATASMFDIDIRAAYEMRIRLGGEQPLGDVEVSLEIPSDLRDQSASSDEVRVLLLNVFDDGEEHLESIEVLSARAAPTDTSISVSLPAVAFYPNADGVFEAHVFLALTPTAASFAQSVKRLGGRMLAALNPIPCALAAGDCLGSSLGHPIGDGTLIRSGFGPRKAPKKGASTQHPGVDFIVTAGTPVKAAAAGTIEIRRQNDKNGELTGYGYYIILHHEGGGATLYGHLTEGSAKYQNGMRVAAGDVIALSGNTGTSTNDHLHFEYAPSGQIFAKDGRVDPTPCLEKLAKGALSVRDNGGVADDSFLITLDGRFICHTEIGQPNSCVLGLLRAGKYTLNINVLVAPDDVGTYEISVNAPNMTIDGMTAVSGSPPQGGSVNHILEVLP